MGFLAYSLQKLISKEAGDKIESSKTASSPVIVNGACKVHNVIYICNHIFANTVLLLIIAIIFC